MTMPSCAQYEIFSLVSDQPRLYSSILPCSTIHTNNALHATGKGWSSPFDDTKENYISFHVRGLAGELTVGSLLPSYFPTLEFGF